MRYVAAVAVLLVARLLPAQNRVLFASDAFTVTAGGVRQGPFAAEAVSRDTIRSSYPRAAQEVRFKFAVGGQDNEFAPGIEHTIYLRPQRGRVETPVYRFGAAPAVRAPEPVAAVDRDERAARVTFRLDLRAAKAELARTGRFVPPRGAAVRSLDPVFVIGDTEPLRWDVRTLSPGAPQQLHDPDGDGIYEATLEFAAQYTRPLARDGRAEWARGTASPAPRAMPTVRSPEPLLDALWRLSLEELAQLRRPDGALAAGAKWPGVWTRDVALASRLAVALVDPDAVLTSLMAKVDSLGRIIQDTGTGGSWPISSDRVTWVLAAWEVFVVTGDTAWLRRALPIIERSFAADDHAVRDPVSGRMRGETSFLDWREQSYPAWMQPADIYASTALGTNAAHLAARRVRHAMRRALGMPAADSSDVVTLAAAVAAQGAAPFTYGRLYPAAAPGTDALAAALLAMAGAPAAAPRVATAAPPNAFGVPVVSPTRPDVPFYHNGTVWPFVTAYWTWAAARQRDAGAVEHGLAASWRVPALFLTNKENLVAATGHFEGTALNSDRQLWSVAGTLAAHLRVLFGLEPGADGLRVSPMVPPAYEGERVLDGWRWRGGTWRVVVRGFGDAPARLVLDGEPLADGTAAIAPMPGAHELVVEMNRRWDAAPLAVTPERSMPAVPSARFVGGRLAWRPVAGAGRYRVQRNGQPFAVVADTSVAAPRRDGADEYLVSAVAPDGTEGFAGEPVRVRPAAAERLAPVLAGRRAVVSVPRAGTYAVEFRYANGHGPVNTEDKAAIRSLRVDGRPAGVVVMPQRGAGAWQDYGWSSVVRVTLTAGRHEFSLATTPLDRNMHGIVNDARIDRVRVTRLTSAPE